MTATFETLRAIDQRLAAAGQYPLPEFWLNQADRLYSHPTANTEVARCGRGSVKSGFGTRVGENEVLAGDFVVPEGEIHYWIDVSENKAEAAQRLRQYETHLTILGVPFERRGDEIVVPHLRRGFMVRAFQIGRVSGFRALGARSDELAKCSSDPTADSPASEVLASIQAMMVTHLKHRPKLLLLSSPVGLLDEHARRFARGDTADQIICFGETWTCNPSISKEETRRVEPDDRIWKREYCAIPQANLSNAFDPDGVARAFRRIGISHALGRPFCVVDASSGGGDAFTWAIAQWVAPRSAHARYLSQLVPRRVTLADRSVVFDEHDLIPDYVRHEDGSPVENPEWRAEDALPPVLLVGNVKAFEGRFAGKIAGSEIVRQIARDCRRAGVHVVIGDQREAFFLGSEFKSHGYRFHPLSWTNSNKIEAVTRLKRQFAEGSIVLSDDEKLKAELLNYSERITASGAIVYSARSAGAHDDRAALLVTAALGEIEGLTDGAPTRVRRQRHEQVLSGGSELIY